MFELLQGGLSESESKPGKAALSLSMIVKNEEKYIERCLTSVIGVVDEIVIVDTGSTDATKELARALCGKAEADGQLPLGFKILDFTWCDDFSAARNAGLDAVSGDWVLVMDADEELSPQSAPIRPLIDQQRLWGYAVRIAVPLDQDSLVNGTYEYFPAMRLFASRSDIRYENVVHENIAVSDTSKFADSKVEIVHFGVAFDGEDDFTQRQERNLRLLYRAVEREPENGYLLACLGSELMIVQDYPEAYNVFMKAMQHSTGTDDPYIPPMLRDIAYCLIETGHVQQAEVLLQDLQKQYPGYTDLFFLEGAIASSKGEVARAKSLYAHCINLGEPKEYRTFGGTGTWRVQGAISQLGPER